MATSLEFVTPDQAGRKRKPEAAALTPLQGSEAAAELMESTAKRIRKATKRLQKLTPQFTGALKDAEDLARDGDAGEDGREAQRARQALVSVRQRMADWQTELESASKLHATLVLLQPPERQQTTGSTGGAPRAMPKDLPKLAIRAGAGLTQQEMADYMDRLSAARVAHAWPMMQHGENRWVADMLVLFTGLTKGDRDFVRSHLDAGSSWEEFAKAATDRWARVDHIQAARTLSTLFQHKAGIRAYADRFVTLASASCRATSDPNWGTTHEIYRYLFLNGLRAPLRTAVTEDPRFTNASVSLDGVMELAFTKEMEAETAAAFQTPGDKSTSKRSSKPYTSNGGRGGDRESRGHSPLVGSREDGRATEKKQKQGAQDKKRSGASCQRCGYNHAGGPAQCFNRYDHSGLLIQGDPAVKNEHQERFFKAGCQTCGNNQHRTFACPSHAQGPKISRMSVNEAATASDSAGHSGYDGSTSDVGTEGPGQALGTARRRAKKVVVLRQRQQPQQWGEDGADAPSDSD